MFEQETGGFNSVTIVGRTGKDPELKYFDSGSVKASVSVAVDRGFKENKQTDWYNIEIWGKTAEFAGQYLKKGREVAISGRLRVHKYNDEAGNEREYLSVVASDMRLMGSKRDNEGGGSYGGGGGYATPPGGGQRTPF